MWKQVAELKDAFNDAVNYRAREQKAFFSKIFLRTGELARCSESNVYFLIGEKGTGKTAYATYIESNPPENVAAKVITLTETQYKRFIELKNNGRLAYSDFANIWRQILLVVASQVIIEKSKGILAGITGKFAKIEAQLKKWNQKALNPEVEVAFETVLNSSLSASIGIEDVASVGAEEAAQQTVKTTSISHSLLESELALKEAIAGLRLSKDHIVFVDGVDFRPKSLSYSDYLTCIRGLGEAVWQLNQEFFSSIRDSKGRIKIVLLVRPDVFHLLSLNNSNSRIQDNSVLLDWATTEKEALDSTLFEACGKYFSSQQPDILEPKVAWNNYFKQPDSFRRLLRLSFQKPRDILTFIKLLRHLQVARGKGGLTSFDESHLADGEFTRKVADYLLGEVRDYASFYMTDEDFGAYIKFFQYLDGKSTFTMDEFQVAFEKFSAWLVGEKITATKFANDAETLLQFFYDVNVIGYKESTADNSETFIHWSFRERSLNNLTPKVKSIGLLTINAGVAKALEIGKEVKSSALVLLSKRTPHPNKRRRGRRGGKGRAKPEPS